MIYSSKGQIKTSHEGIMIGDGTLGALIYGTNNLIISLDKIDLYIGGTERKIKLLKDALALLQADPSDVVVFFA